MTRASSTPPAPAPPFVAPSLRRFVASLRDSLRRLRATPAALLIALAAAPPAPADDGPPEALRSLSTANGLLERGLDEMAAGEYRVFLERYPAHEKTALAEYGLGVSLYRLGRHADALDTLSALAGRPEFEYAVETAVIRGQCLLELGRFDEAARVLRDVPATHPAHDLADDAAALLVEACERGGDHAGAEAAWRALSQRWPLAPRRERADYFRGMALVALGRHEEAAAHLEEMVRRAPEGPLAEDALLLQAQALHRTGAPQRAAEPYRRVIRGGNAGRAPAALYGLASLLSADGEDRDAEAQLAQLLERYPQSDLAPDALLLRGRILVQLGRNDEAAACLDRIDPGAAGAAARAPAAAYWRAKADLRRGRPAAAAARLEDAIARFPNADLLAEMTYDLAIARLRAEDDAGALSALETFLARFSDHALAAEALRLSARALHDQARFDESLAACRRFLEKHPRDASAAAMALLASENLLRLDRLEEAAAAYRILLDRYPEAPERADARARLGLTLYRLGRGDEAEPLLTDAVAGAAEDHPQALLALGDLAFGRGEWERAERALAGYLALDPVAPAADDALLKLGLALARQGRRDDALATLDRLLATQPESPHRAQATFERGRILADLGRADEAARAFRAVAEGGGDTRLRTHALLHLGAIAVARGEHDVAAGLFHDAASAAAGDDDLVAEAQFQAGQAHLAAGDLDGAVAALGDVLDRHPTSTRADAAAARLAIALARQGRHELALARMEDLDRAGAGSGSGGRGGARLEPALRAALSYEKAWCLRALGREAAAADAYRAVLALPPSTVRPYASLELAELEMKTQRLDEAAALLQALVAALDAEAAPDPALLEPALYRLGVCAYERERWSEAASALDRLVRERPQAALAPAAAQLCGEARLRGGDHLHAAECFRTVVERYPADAACEPSLLRLGECYAALQHWARSEETLAEHRRRFPDAERWYQAQFGIGWARENQGRLDDAVAAYREVTARHDGETAARAQFQIGECLFAQQAFADAARELLEVDILYAFPQWSAAALYEAGRCFERLGQSARARRQLEEVVARHGDTRWARLASDRLAQLGAPLPEEEAGATGPAAAAAAAHPSSAKESLP